MKKWLKVEEKDIVTALFFTFIILFQTIPPIFSSHLHLHNNIIMDMERGPRYNAYAKLRETKLQNNYLRLQQYQQQQQQENEIQVETKIPTPPTKQVKFHASVVSSGRKGSSLIAQSVPDFSSMLRKENRKPTNIPQPSTTTLTPPLKNKNKGCVGGGGVLSSSRGNSRSANAAAEKRKGGGILMARKSYANFDELRSFSSATANAINGEGRNSRVVGKNSKTVLRCREL